MVNLDATKSRPFLFGGRKPTTTAILIEHNWHWVNLDEAKSPSPSCSVNILIEPHWHVSQSGRSLTQVAILFGQFGRRHLD
jgi:hypothetical protein